MAQKRISLPETHSTRAVLAPRDVARIRAETLIDERTIRKWGTGGKVRLSSARSIQLACSKLAITVRT